MSIANTFMLPGAQQRLIRERHRALAERAHARVRDDLLAALRGERHYWRFDQPEHRGIEPVVDTDPPTCCDLPLDFEVVS